MYQLCSSPWSNIWGNGFFFTSARNMNSADALRSVRKNLEIKVILKKLFRCDLIAFVSTPSSNKCHTIAVMPPKLLRKS